MLRCGTWPCVSELEHSRSLNFTARIQWGAKQGRDPRMKKKTRLGPGCLTVIGTRAAGTSSPETFSF